MIADDIHIEQYKSCSSIPHYAEDMFPLNSPCVIKWEPVGSQMIKGAPGPGSDRDYLLMTSDWNTVINQFLEMEFSHDGEDSGYTTDNPHRFVSMRKGDYNFVVTQDDWFYERFMRAQKLAERLGVTNKEDRIDLFRAVRDE